MSSFLELFVVNNFLVVVDHFIKYVLYVDSTVYFSETAYRIRLAVNAVKVLELWHSAGLGVNYSCVLEDLFCRLCQHG